jgi:hypothetical protein
VTIELPRPTPVTTPDALPIVATGLAEVHIPPAVVLESVVVLPMQTPFEPVIADNAGNGFTVAFVVFTPVAVQLLASVMVTV